ncbi:hypothetical protein ILUMI_05850, partial [Ignelater luminosus]
RIPNVEIYIDDILIHAKTKLEHDKCLEKVLQIARKKNIKFNLKKCQFGIPEVKYLGYKFSKTGILIDEERIDDIIQMPCLKDKKEDQKFLGLITYVGRFINNLSNITQPLRDLIKQDNIFEWGTAQKNAFIKLKAGISFYDPEQFGNEDFAPSLVTDICLKEFTDNVLEATLVEEPPQPGRFFLVLASQPGCSTDVSVQDLYVEINCAPLHVAPPPSGCATNISIDVLDLDIVCEDGTVISSKKVEE